MQRTIFVAGGSGFGGRLTAGHARLHIREQARMDANLFGAPDSSRVKRVVDGSGTCCYGNLGTELCDETATPDGEMISLRTAKPL